MIWHDIQQNTEEWEALRVGKATASNFGLIMANAGKAFGDPAKRYALQIALEQIKGCKSEFSFSNEHMERGHEQEPVARMLYEEMNFIDADNGGFFDHGTYGDSPDGLIGADGVIEIKSVISPTHYATLKRGSFDPSYRWQLVGHLDCTGRDWVDFVSYCADFPEDKQLVVWRLTREECAEEIESLRERRDQFLSLVQEVKRSILEA
ncbi:lambda exonuclease family protein [Pectobacterium carotovorum]|uniref:lambda exonuclease family protein n=1 Tax=Pectobacterium carotovorum TaxID=554 RepID=UPI0021F37768|nr:lambda exonuclease family protein [Pectobacterium carotovorum]